MTNDDFPQAPNPGIMNLSSLSEKNQQALLKMLLDNGWEEYTMPTHTSEEAKQYGEILRRSCMTRFDVVGRARQKSNSILEVSSET